MASRWAVSSFGKKDDADAKRTAFVEREAALGEEPLAGNGGGDADAVAGFAVGRNGAAVLKTREGAECMLQNLVGRLGRELGDEPDATGVEIETRVDQAAVYIGGQGREGTISGRGCRGVIGTTR